MTTNLTFHNDLQVVGLIHPLEVRQRGTTSKPAALVALGQIAPPFEPNMPLARPRNPALSAAAKALPPRLLANSTTFKHFGARFDSDLGQTHFVGHRLGPRRSAATCSGTGRPSQASASRIYSVAVSPSAPLSGDVRCLTALHLIGLIRRQVSFAAHTPCEKCATPSRCSEDAVQTDYANAT